MDTAPTDIYTLSLHDALPIFAVGPDFVRAAGHGVPGGRARLAVAVQAEQRAEHPVGEPADEQLDRKSTRLNSSHMSISYAVFCLKKKTTLSAVSVAPGLSMHG